MAKTGIKIKRCNVGSVEAHNKRTKDYLEGLAKAGRALYYFPELSPDNISWENPKYEGKSCAVLFDEMKKLYTDRVGQPPQLKDRERISKKTGKKTIIAGWSPIREGCPPIKEDTTIEDFQPVIDWARENGLDVIRIDLHFDEGHIDAETKERKLNRHAHVVFDWLDHETGRTIKLNDAKMSELQGIMATALGMERGKPKAETGVEHIAAAEYREMKAAETAQRMETLALEIEEKIDELSKTAAAKEEAISVIKEFGSKMRELISGKDKREKQDLAEKLDKVTKIAKNNRAAAIEEREKRMELEKTLESTSASLKAARDEINSLREAVAPVHKKNYDLQKEIDNIKRNLPEVLPEATSIGLSIEDALTLASGKELLIRSLKTPDGTALSMEGGKSVRLRWNKRIEAYLASTWHTVKDWCREALRSPWCAVNGISNNPRQRRGLNI